MLMFVFAACFIGLGTALLIIFLAYKQGCDAGATTTHEAFEMMLGDLRDDLKTARENAFAAEQEARLVAQERDHWKGLATQDGTAWSRVRNAYERMQAEASTKLFNLERRALNAETERERLLAEVADLWSRLDAKTNNGLAQGEPRDTLTNEPTLPSAVGVS